MSEPTLPFRAGVLVGGASRRMGTPKQLLALDGRSFLERVVAALGARASSVVLLGDGPAPEACAGLPRIADAPGAAGPVAGVLAALRSGPGELWMIAACDQPLLSVAAVDWLAAQAAPDVWAVLPRIAGGVEPFPGLYDPRCADMLEEAARRGPAGPSALAGHARTRCPVPPAALVAAWRNVNTPEEAESLRRAAP